MSALVAFEWQGEAIRVVMIDDRPNWVAVDIAGALGYSRATNMVRMVPPHQKGTHEVSTLRGSQKLTVLTEGGVYRAVMNSERPEAEKFVDWLTDEVLPSLRATGRYEMPGRVAIDQEGECDDDPLLADLSLEQRLALVNSARLIHGKKGAAAIWRRVGLPDPLEEDGVRLDLGAASDPRFTSINLWMDERCQFVPGHMEESSALHADYRLWCANNGHEVHGITAFGRHLNRRGVPGRKSGRVWRVGLKLKPVAALVTG